MPNYQSPGVYVEEIPSAVKAIAGVSTSVVGFIGIVPDSLTIPTSPVIEVSEDVQEIDNTNTKDTFPLKQYPVNKSPGTYRVRVGAEEAAASLIDGQDAQGKTIAQVKFDKAPTPATKVKITIDYIVLANQVTNEVLDKGDGSKTRFKLQRYPVNDRDHYQVRVNGTAVDASKVKLQNVDDGSAYVVFQAAGDAPKAGDQVAVDYQASFPTFKPVDVEVVKFCTNFSEFKRSFGDFSVDEQQRYLAHAVYGFFSNGGSQCYVTRVKQESDISVDLLARTFEPYDDISIVAAPGVTNTAAVDAIKIHCQVNTKDRFAIFDSAKTMDDAQHAGFLDVPGLKTAKPPNSDYAAFYTPWLQVLDPALKTMFPKGDGLFYVPPSGHVAGIYARVDNSAGVHKAPANEVVLGALGLKYNISKSQQDSLNPDGINCIRNLNGNITVWGARTIGGNSNQDLKYINVRRTLLYLRDSIDKGTQWVVFEPNTPALWEKIKRNVSAFLTTVWRSGALFGNTPQEAFYVKCDAETNPPELREVGQVVTEIGVAIVRPAEFVIFRISQWQPPSK
ncbi:phage tail sheath family protein [Pantanalinema rosaneae CENA516]|uniref:phage tail sheath family protein n=1 Tax=Pantanalinema rosaneae TaxID=1620701 RepID=UPI003D6FC6AE